MRFPPNEFRRVRGLQAAILLSLCLTLAACGYRLGDCSCLQQYQTVTVPFVQGDMDGRLTNAIIRELEGSGGFQYCPSGGSLTLYVCVADRGNDNIGFEYDFNSPTNRTKRIVPNEGRLTAMVEVRVCETASGTAVLGPICLCESVDYDYDPLVVDNTLSTFSIGQVVSFDAAEDAALTPLYDRLARKIVDSLSACW